ncbi:MAG: hypothetical protein KME23_25405 [Goleter apudmare HA4340-LM2]|jgi:hypothetical protein|nr:hypothetical protein [Goleter apudmare HA4340-LM2]
MTNNISGDNGLSSQSQVSSHLVSDQSRNVEVKVTQTTTLRSPVNRFRIVHTTTGRVRIRTSENSFDSKLESISQYLRQMKGVREVISNQQTGSLVVSFDESQLSLPQVLETLQKFGVVDSESASKIDIFAEWKSPTYWQEQSISFIPLVTGLAVTGGLGISGWVAIPVYMITADATRWIIDSLEPQILSEEKQQDLDKVAKTNLSPASLSTEEEKQINTINQENQPTKPSAKIAYHVVHAIPGRIRFHVPRLAYDRPYARRLESLLKTDAQVTNVRVNRDAASIAIAYLDREISVSHWVSLMQLALQNHLPTNSTPTVSQSTEKKTVSGGKGQKASSIWANMKSTSLSYALAFLANFSFV